LDPARHSISLMELYNSGLLDFCLPLLMHRGGPHGPFYASPFKHPATGVYWYRQRVPARSASAAKGKLVTVTVDSHPSRPPLGADIKVSLRTKSPAEAKRLALEAQAEFDRIWLSFENGPVRLSLRQITALAGEMYHVIRPALEDDPGAAAEWAQRRRDRQTSVELLHRSLCPWFQRLLWTSVWLVGRRSLSEHYLVVDADTRQRKLLEFDKVVGDIALLSWRRGQSDFSEDVVGKRFSTFAPAPTVLRSGRLVEQR
jgi:hypothetical protein